jgi:hypothetical protein
MKKNYIGLKTLAFCAMSMAALPPAVMPTASAQVIHKQIPLDAGGWFSGLAVHSSGRLYGYGDVYGTFRSDNFGESWQYLQNKFTSNDNFVSGMDVATGNADIVAFRSPNSLYISSDGGTNWTPSLTDLGYMTTNGRAGVGLVRGASPVMYRPNNDQEIWLASKRVSGSTTMTGTLWRSGNGGVPTNPTSWTKAGGTTFDNVEALTVYARPEFPNQIWVGTRNGVYVSVDGGTNFTPVWTGSYVKAIVRNHKGIVYFVAGNGGYIITSTDSTWQNTGSYNVTRKVFDYDTWTPEQAAVLADGRFLSGGPYYNAPKNLNLNISDSNGDNWAPVPGMNLSPSPRPVWSAPIVAGQKLDYGRDFIVQHPTIPSRWMATGGFAPAITENSGQDWKFVPNNGGLAGVMTYKVSFARSNSNRAFIPGSDLGVFTVTDGGSSGNAANVSRTSVDKHLTVHEVMSNDGVNIVAAGVFQSEPQPSAILTSNNSGGSWTELTLTNSNLPVNRGGITRSVMNPTNANDFIVVLSSNGSSTTAVVWRTTNGGGWFDPVVGLPTNIDTGSMFHPEHSNIMADGQNPNVRYFSSNKSGQFYRSTNNGGNWTPMTSPYGPGAGAIQDLAVDRAVEGKLWVAGAWGGVKTSNDGGVSWTHVGSSYPVSGFTGAKLVDAANGQVAVWGTRAGDSWNKIYWSHDNGLNWSEATGPNNRYAFTRELAVDPWVKGKIWVSGISVNVISGLPGSTTPQPTPTPTPTQPPVGSGTGLKGEYFSGDDFTTGVQTQTDPTVDFNWGPDSPKKLDGTTMTSVGPNTFSVRWTGQIQAVETGSYTFSVVADDTAKVWINDTLVINQTAYRNLVPLEGSINLNANQKYNIKIDFTEGSGGARIHLRWKRPTTNTVVTVPKEQLFPTTTTNPVGPDVTYGFSDTTGNSAPVDGVHEGVNFGEGFWGAGSYYFGDNQQSGWFWNNESDNRSFTLPTGKRLKSIKLSTGIAGSTWKISGGAGNAEHSGEFGAAETPITVNLTNWTNPSPTVTITFSAKWDSAIDDIVYGQ